MSIFAPGALVLLKSGGPLMTVEKTYKAADGQRVTCHWFDKDNKPSKENFRPEMLEAYNTDEGPTEPQFL